MGEVDAGQRLDRFLVERLEGWSRSRLQGLIRDGLVEVGGRAERKAGAPLAAGASVRVELPPRDPKATPEQGRSLVVLHEDEALLVVDKPAGLLTHRLESGAEVSLAELAEARCGPLPSVQGEGRPGIVHRLDRHTSGVVVLAKQAPALEALLRQFRDREVKKTYAVLTAGEPRFASDWIEAPLGRDPRRPDRVRVLTPAEGGREAATFYEVQERLDGFTYLHCFPKTGRTHQIRVHLNHLGLEVLGDTVYRLRNSRLPSLPPEAPKPRRQMLHALRLELKHPVSGEPLEFEAELPADFGALLAWLKSRSSG